MKYERLGDIVEISKGKKHNTVEVPGIESKRIIGINDLRNDSTIIFTEDKNGIDVNEKDILIAWDGANAGTIGYGKKGYIGSTISRLRIKNTSRYNEIFIGKLLQSKFDYLRATTTGAIIPHINRAVLDNIKIPQFNLSDQIRISTVLSQTEKLIAKRKESINALDELLKCTFFEMFGNLTSNEKGFQISHLSKFITHITSGGRGWSKYYSNDGDRFIRSIDVQMNYIDKDNAVFVIPPKGKESERTKVRTGDVLLTITGSSIGRVAYIQANFGVAYVSQHVAIIRTQGINPIYLSFFLSMPNSGQLIIRKQQYGQTKPGLNLKQIKSFPILNAPIILQEKFSNIVKKVEFLKSKYVQNLTELENLYGSLSQRAFKGELDLSKVQFYETEIEELEINKVRFEGELQNISDFTKKDLFELIKKHSGKIFNFDELWIDIESLTDKKIPSKNTIQNQIIELLESDKENFQQVFDILTSKAKDQYVEKQIAFRGNYEN